MLSKWLKTCVFRAPVFLFKNTQKLSSLLSSFLVLFSRRLSHVVCAMPHLLVTRKTRTTVGRPGFAVKSRLIFALNNALCHHGLGHLEEACHVGAFYIVDVAVRLFAILHAVVMNVVHDAVELGIHLLAGPFDTL